MEHLAVNRSVVSSSFAIPDKEEVVQMNGSQIAAEIDYDYRMRKKYGRKRAKKCKDKGCAVCGLKEICTESEEKK